MAGRAAQSKPGGDYAPATLITGASSGLGAEFARQCARRGERLVLVARREDRLKEIADEVGGAEIIVADLSEPGAATKVVGETMGRGLWVRTLINNAGFGLIGKFDELPLRRQLEMIDLNVRALTNLSFVVIRDMVLKGGGAILNVASTAAFQPGPKMAVYFATKAFVLSLSEALHEELKPHGIKVSCLCPGPTRTEFGDVAGFGGNRLFDRVAMDSPAVVRAGLAGLKRNRAVVVPGVINKVGAAGTRFAPRPMVRKIAGSIKY
jgi:short-subunit dehydrogenase